MNPRDAEREQQRAYQARSEELVEALTYAKRQLLGGESCWLPQHYIGQTPNGESFCLVCFGVVYWSAGYHAGKAQAHRDRQPVTISNKIHPEEF